MNKARYVSAALRLVKPLSSVQFQKKNPLRLLNQVTPFSLLPTSSSQHLSFHSHSPLGVHQRLFSSSNASSSVEPKFSIDWNDYAESLSAKSNPDFTHDLFVYGLKKLHKKPLEALEFFDWVCEEKGFEPNSLVYSLMLRILVGKGTMEQFWETVKEMKEKGFYIDEETYLTIMGFLKNVKMDKDVTAFAHFRQRMITENAMEDAVKKVVVIIVRSDWGEDVENRLLALNISISDNFLLRALKELRQHPLKACQFFKWVGNCTDYKHSSVSYNALLRILARHDSIDKFWDVLKEIRSKGFEMDIDTYIKISRNFQKFKMMKDAVELYEFMMDGPYKPSPQDCILLLKSISVNPDLDLVNRVAKRFKEAGHKMSKAIYDGIHRSLTSVGKFDEAKEVVEDMKSAGYEPDNITYSQLIFGYCKAGRLEEACGLLDEMQANGCPPDIKTYTILITGCCDANQMDKALLCFAKLMENNLNPDADLLEVLIKGFFAQNKVDGAYTLVTEMVDKGLVKPWQATYKHIIDKLLEARKLEEALQLLSMMKKDGYPRYSEPFVQYVSKFGSIEDARTLLKVMTLKEHPSVSVYLHLFRSFFREGRHSEAKDLFFKSPHHIRSHKEISNLFGAA